MRKNRALFCASLSAQTGDRWRILLPGYIFRSKKRYMERKCGPELVGNYAVLLQTL